MFALPCRWRFAQAAWNNPLTYVNGRAWRGPCDGAPSVRSALFAVRALGAECKGRDRRAQQKARVSHNQRSAVRRAARAGVAQWPARERNAGRVWAKDRDARSPGRPTFRGRDGRKRSQDVTTDWQAAVMANWGSLARAGTGCPGGLQGMDAGQGRRPVRGGMGGSALFAVPPRLAPNRFLGGGCQRSRVSQVGHTAACCLRGCVARLWGRRR